MAKHRKKKSKTRVSKRPKGPSRKERVQLMKKNFMELHKAGYTVQKVARMYDLGETTVYNALEEIAAANNIPRDTLLWKVKRNEKPATQSEVGIQHDVNVVSENEAVPQPNLEADAKPTDVQLPSFENVEEEYTGNKQVLSVLFEVATQLDDTITQLLEEEKRYA